MMRQELGYAVSRAPGRGTRHAAIESLIRIAFFAIAALLGQAALSLPAHAQSQTDAGATETAPAPTDKTVRLGQVKAETLKLMQAGRFADAVPLAEEALRLTEGASGADSVETAVSAHNLGFLLRRAGRADEARQNFERALAIYQRVHPAVHEDTRNAAGELGQIYLRGGRGEEVAGLYAKLIARAAEEGYSAHIGAAHLHNNYAFILRSLGRPEMAEAEWLKAATIYSTKITPEDDAYRLAIDGLLDRYSATGRTDAARALAAETLNRLESVGQSGGRAALRLLNRLSTLEHAAGRYTEAKSQGAAAIALAEKAGPEAVSELIAGLNNLARAERALANFADAEALYKRAIALLDGKGDGANAGILNDNLAAMLGQVGRLDEAERYNKRALQLLEQALGHDHKEVGVAAGNFGVLLKEARRYREAEPLLRRGLAIAEKQSPQDRVGIGIITDNLAGLLRLTDRPRDALVFSERAMALFTAALPADHPTYATALNNFGHILLDLGRYAEAKEPLAKSLELAERRLGADHLNTAIFAANLGKAYFGLGDKPKARELFTKALTPLEARFGSGHRITTDTLLSLGSMELAEGKPAAAVAFFERAVAIEAAAEQRAGLGAPTSTKQGASGQDAYFRLIEALWQQMGSDGNEAAMLRAAEIGQRSSIGRAALAVAALGARAGAGDPALAALTRQRQDLAAEWQGTDEKLIDLLSRTSGRDDAAEQSLRDRLAAIETQLAALDMELTAKFPSFGELAQPAPLPVEEVRALLSPNEAAIQLAVGAEATHLWLITKGRLRWLRVPVTKADLTDKVRALRCGLDSAEWQGGGRTRCQQLLDLPADFTPRGILPFHTGKAHALYKLLLAPLGEAIAGKDLILVASGPLTSLPFQLLITEDPEARDKSGGRETRLEKAAWLVRQHSVTVLPSLASLRPLRQLARSSRATSPFLGIGNPLLTGESGNDRRAWSRQACDAPEPPAQKSIEVASAAPVTQLLRGTPINPETLRRQPPLPETAEELCTVARHIGAPQQSVLLGANATEARLKSLSETGELATARVVHFATHGLLAGETETLLASRAEPALMLTPPETASDKDDGLLTASEVAGLKLDAELVVLSACNTASGDHVGGEALSGLARAFFYAGARSLLVSHWAVDTEATVKLIVKGSEVITRNPRIGQAEALRQAMLSLIVAGGRQAHPSYWAPFVVVGGDARTDAAPVMAMPAASETTAAILPPLPQRIPAALRAPAPLAASPTPPSEPQPANDWMNRVFSD